MKDITYKNLENIFLKTLEHHAPLKKKIVRANNVPYKTKTLRKAILRRSAQQITAKNTKSTKSTVANYTKKK